MSGAVLCTKTLRGRRAPHPAPSDLVFRDVRGSRACPLASGDLCLGTTVLRSAENAQTLYVMGFAHATAICPPLQADATVRRHDSGKTHWEQSRAANSRKCLAPRLRSCCPREPIFQSRSVQMLVSPPNRSFFLQCDHWAAFVLARVPWLSCGFEALWDFCKLSRRTAPTTQSPLRNNRQFWSSTY